MMEHHTSVETSEDESHCDNARAMARLQAVLSCDVTNPLSLRDVAAYYTTGSFDTEDQEKYDEFLETLCLPDVFYLDEHGCIKWDHPENFVEHLKNAEVAFRIPATELGPAGLPKGPKRYVSLESILKACTECEESVTKEDKHNKGKKGKKESAIADVDAIAKKIVSSENYDVSRITDTMVRKQTTTSKYSHSNFSFKRNVYFYYKMDCRSIEDRCKTVSEVMVKLLNIVFHRLLIYLWSPYDAQNDMKTLAQFSNSPLGKWVADDPTENCMPNFYDALFLEDGMEEWATKNLILWTTLNGVNLSQEDVERLSGNQGKRDKTFYTITQEARMKWAQKINMTEIERFVEEVYMSLKGCLSTPHGKFCNGDLSDKKKEFENYNFMCVYRPWVIMFWTLFAMTKEGKFSSLKIVVGHKGTPFTDNEDILHMKKYSRDKSKNKFWMHQPLYNHLRNLRQSHSAAFSELTNTQLQYQKILDEIRTVLLWCISKFNEYFINIAQTRERFLLYGSMGCALAFTFDKSNQIASLSSDLDIFAVNFENYHQMNYFLQAIVVETCAIIEKRHCLHGLNVDSPRLHWSSDKQILLGRSVSLTVRKLFIDDTELLNVTSIDDGINGNNFKHNILCDCNEDTILKIPIVCARSPLTKDAETFMNKQLWAFKLAQKAVEERHENEKGHIYGILENDQSFKERSSGGGAVDLAHVLKELRYVTFTCSEALKYLQDASNATPDSYECIVLTVGIENLIINSLSPFFMLKSFDENGKIEATIDTVRISLDERGNIEESYTVQIPKCKLQEGFRLVKVARMLKLLQSTFDDIETGRLAERYQKHFQNKDFTVDNISEEFDILCSHVPTILANHHAAMLLLVEISKKMKRDSTPYTEVDIRAKEDKSQAFYMRAMDGFMDSIDERLTQAFVASFAYQRLQEPPHGPVFEFHTELLKVLKALRTITDKYMRVVVCNGVHPIMNE